MQDVQPHGMVPVTRRRGLLGAAAAALAALLRPGRGHAEPESRNPLLSMAEIRNAERDPPEMVQRRFDLYSSLGCGGLRTGLGWREFEKHEGSWTVDRRYHAYYDLVRRNGFRLKTQMGAVSAVPDWFFDRYPDAHLVNQRGDSPKGLMSPWYPAAPAILAEKLDRVFATAREFGAFETMDYLIVDLGPAGEPTYPAAWETGPGYTPANALFWYFDPHAQADFGPKMEQAYAGDLTRANGIWGTRFGSWAEVTPPIPNTIRGPIWHDLIKWYFDAKRRMISGQIAEVNRLIAKHSPGHPIRPMLLMPGEHATQEDFDLTAANGLGTYLVKIAADTDFMVDEAARTGCWLQYG